MVCRDFGGLPGRWLHGHMQSGWGRVMVTMANTLHAGRPRCCLFCSCFFVAAAAAAAFIAKDMKRIAQVSSNLEQLATQSP